MGISARERLKENISEPDALIDVVSIEDMGALLNVVYGKDGFNDGLEAAAKIADGYALSGAVHAARSGMGNTAVQIAQAIRAAKKGTTP